MAKRRRRKPNISKAALEQARQAVGEGETESRGTAAAPPKQEAPPASAAAKPRRRRRDLQNVQLDKRQSEGQLDAEYVAELLANPTKVVTEEDLRADYSFVIKDLRNMGVLAAVLFAALIAISLLVL